jgi:hypothetical protein
MLGHLLQKFHKVGQVLINTWVLLVLEDNREGESGVLQLLQRTVNQRLIQVQN